MQNVIWANKWNDFETIRDGAGTVEILDRILRITSSTTVGNRAYKLYYFNVEELARVDASIVARALGGVGGFSIDFYDINNNQLKTVSRTFNNTGFLPVTLSCISPLGARFARVVCGIWTDIEGVAEYNIPQIFVDKSFGVPKICHAVVSMDTETKQISLMDKYPCVGIESAKWNPELKTVDILLDKTKHTKKPSVLALWHTRYTPRNLQIIGDQSLGSLDNQVRIHFKDISAETDIPIDITALEFANGSFFAFSVTIFR